MSGVILPGLQGEPQGTFVLPMMRGFPCDVAAPQVKGAKANKPVQGIGIGASNVLGKGPMFFVSVTAFDDTLVAQLNYAHYRRLCELLASAGDQLLLAGIVAPNGEGDAFGACEVALPAIAAALLAYGEQRVMTQDEAQACADALGKVEKAVGVSDVAV